MTGRDLKRRGLGAWLVVLAVAATPVACVIAFPNANQPHHFACRDSTQCIDGYVCGSDCRCDPADEANVGMCPPNGVASDGGTPGADGGTPGTDGGTPGTDGGVPGTDGGVPGTDGGTPGSDGGTVACDGQMVIVPPVVYGSLSNPIKVPFTVYPVSAPAGASGTLTVGEGLPMQAGCATVDDGVPGDPTTVACTASSLASAANQPQTVTLDLGADGCFTGTVLVRDATSTDSLSLDPAMVPHAAMVPVTITVSDPGLNGVFPVDMPLRAYALDINTNTLTPLLQPLADPRSQGPGKAALDVLVPASQLILGDSFDVVVVAGDVVVRGGGLVVSVSSQAPAITRVAPTELPVGTASVLTLAGAGLGATGGAVDLTCGKSTTPVPTTAVSADAVQRTVKVTLPAAAAGEHCQVHYHVGPPPSLGADAGGLVAYDPAKAPPAWVTAANGPHHPRLDAGATVVTTPDGLGYLVIAGGRGTGGPVTQGFAEIAPIQDDGDLGAFGDGPGLPGGSGQPDSLISPAVTSFGPMVYVLGGSYNAIPSARVYRADVLWSGQRVTGLSADYLPGQASTTVPGGGQAFYAVTAVLTPTATVADPTPDPLGETPASRLLTVNPPNLSGLEVILHWDAYPKGNVVGYRIYRGTKPSNLVAVGTVPAASRSYLDDGGTLAGGGPPPEVGQLSQWLEVPQTHELKQARVGATAVVVPGYQSPPTPTLVVAGGEDKTVLLDSLEAATLGAAGDASMGRFDEQDTLSAARRGLQARVLPAGAADGTNPTTPHVIFGPGVQADGTSPVNTVGVWQPGNATAAGTPITLPGSDSLGPDNGFFLGPQETILQTIPPIGGAPQAYVAPLYASGSLSPAGGYTTPAGYPAPPVTAGQATAQGGGDAYVVSGADGGGTPIGKIWRAVR